MTIISQWKQQFPSGRLDYKFTILNNSKKSLTIDTYRTKKTDFDAKFWWHHFWHAESTYSKYTSQSDSFTWNWINIIHLKKLLEPTHIERAWKDSDLHWYCSDFIYALQKYFIWNEESLNTNNNTNILKTNKYNMHSPCVIWTVDNKNEKIFTFSSIVDSNK